MILESVFDLDKFVLVLNLKLSKTEPRFCWHTIIVYTVNDKVTDKSSFLPLFLFLDVVVVVVKYSMDMIGEYDDVAFKNFELCQKKLSNWEKFVQAKEKVKKWKIAKFETPSKRNQNTCRLSFSLFSFLIFMSYPTDQL